MRVFTEKELERLAGVANWEKVRILIEGALNAEYKITEIVTDHQTSQLLLRSSRDNMTGMGLDFMFELRDHVSIMGIKMKWKVVQPMIDLGSVDLTEEMPLVPSKIQQCLYLTCEKPNGRIVYVDWPGTDEAFL